MASLEDRMRAFVASHTGVGIAGVQRETRLKADLGLDGTRAVGFFEAYAATFDVDVEDVWKHWKAFFGTEGFTLQSSILLLTYWLIVDLAGLVLLPRLRLWMLLPINLVLLGMWSWIISMRKKKAPPKREITVDDLLTAVPEQRLRLRGRG